MRFIHRIGPLAVPDRTIDGPTSIETVKSATARTYTQIFIEDDWREDWAGFVWVTATLFESDKSTLLKEAGWTLELSSHLQSDRMNVECSDSNPIPSGYTCYYYKKGGEIWASHPSHLLVAWNCSSFWLYIR